MSPEIECPVMGLQGNGPSGVYAATTGDIYLIQGNGELYHFDGKLWSRVSIPSSIIGFEDALAVSGSGSNNVFVAGNGQHVGRWNGSTWQDSVTAGIGHYP